MLIQLTPKTLYNPKFRRRNHGPLGDAKKKTNDTKYKREMTFTQTNRQPSKVSTNNYLFSFYEKAFKKVLWAVNLTRNRNTAYSGTDHTLTTDKNKVRHRKLIIKPITISEYDKAGETDRHSSKKVRYYHLQNRPNQSRICGKGVGLGLFPSDSLESQSYEFIEIAHIGPYYGVENDCKNFVRIV